MVMWYLTALALSCIAWPCVTGDEPTWVEIDNNAYGAEPKEIQ